MTKKILWDDAFRNKLLLKIKENEYNNDGSAAFYRSMMQSVVHDAFPDVGDDFEIVMFPYDRSKKITRKSTSTNH